MRALFRSPFPVDLVQACPSGAGPTTRKVVPPPFGLGPILPAATRLAPQFGLFSPVLTPSGRTSPKEREAAVRGTQENARTGLAPPARRLADWAALGRERRDATAIGAPRPATRGPI